MKYGKDPIFWSTPSMPFYETRQAHHLNKARQARHFMKHTEDVGTKSPKSTRALQAREQVRRLNT